MKKEEWMELGKDFITYLLTVVYCIAGAMVIAFLSWIPKVNRLVAEALHRGLQGKRPGN